MAIDKKLTLSDAVNSGLYAVEQVKYNTSDLCNKIKMALDYSNNSLRELWSKNHKRDDILQKYLEIIKNYMG